MIAQGFVIENDKVLMVRQHVKRGAIVCNFPGGGIEQGESPKEACIREVKEETGYDIRIDKQLYYESGKYTFIAHINNGQMFVNNKLKENVDIIEAAWVSIKDGMKGDDITLPILDLYLQAKDPAAN